MGKTKKSGLNDGQAQFVIEYCRDFNATKAAKRAGYSDKTAYSQGHELLKKPEIQAAIEKHLAKHNVTANRVVAELQKVAFADMADYLTVDEDTGGVKAVSFDEMEPGASRAVKKVKERRKIIASGEDNAILEANFEFEHHDKLKALEMLGRALNLFGDKPTDDQMDVLRDAASPEELVVAIRKLSGR